MRGVNKLNRFFIDFGLESMLYQKNYGLQSCISESVVNVSAGVAGLNRIRMVIDSCFRAGTGNYVLDTASSFSICLMADLSLRSPRSECV